MRKIFVITGIVILNFFLSRADGAPVELKTPKLRNSVIKIFVTTNPPDFIKPWQTKGSDFHTGSGCIIDGNRILTSAHVISDYTFIQVKKHSDPKKYTAKVEAVGHDCDLAILSVEDPEFFKGTQPIPLGETPSLKDSVTVIGYPVGGEQLSVTQGIVSRIEVTTYSHSLKSLLSVQIDAAINPGNSGGPVVQDGTLVGVAFQGLEPGENIGYMVPPPVIRHFFKDLEDGKYDGFPVLGIISHNTENPFLRQFYKINNRTGGVLVSQVAPGSPAGGVVKKEDVIMAVDGIPIAEDGTVSFREDERVLFTYRIHLKQMGDPLTLTVVRDGNESALTIKLMPFQELVPPAYFYQEPTYYVFGGFVFTILSNDLLKEEVITGMNDLLNLHYYNMGPGRMRPKGRKEIVLLLNVLPDEANIGYHNVMCQIVDRVNGKRIKSFQDLVLALQAKPGPFTSIETEQYAKVLLDNTGNEETNARILANYHIPSLCSKDVAEWLEGYLKKNPPPSGTVPPQESSTTAPAA
ncbi:MAG: trypsin-like peptidase domain-containing protein [Candidatus Omnitrophica bacterium]|nr:trypsin-like peptidase domain-containing protein [Candidatus Omnitrophota bacterium]